MNIIRTHSNDNNVHQYQIGRYKHVDMIHTHTHIQLGEHSSDDFACPNRILFTITHRMHIYPAGIRYDDVKKKNL